MIDESKLSEAYSHLSDTVNQFRAASAAYSTEEVEYWQGRKDGARLMYAILTGDDDKRDLVDTSPGSRIFDYELHQELLRDAVYHVSAILYELKTDNTADYRTIMNLGEFIRRYDYLAEKGTMPMISDHCLVKDV